MPRSGSGGENLRPHQDNGAGGRFFDNPRRTVPRRGEKALRARSASEGSVDSLNSGHSDSVCSGFGEKLPNLFVSATLSNSYWGWGPGFNRYNMMLSCAVVEQTLEKKGVQKSRACRGSSPPRSSRRRVPFVSSRSSSSMRLNLPQSIEGLASSVVDELTGAAYL